MLSCGFPNSDTKAWYIKWRGVVRNARVRGLECTLTFRQYLQLAKRAKLVSPAQIGMAVEQYNLSRRGDTGGYVQGNCRFITSKQNRRERVTNGCFDALAEERRGWNKHNHSGIARAAEQSRVRMSNPKFVAKLVKNWTKDFELTSPRGTVYTGNNLAAFCRKHRLAHSSMAAVCGRGKSINGWTGRYL